MERIKKIKVDKTAKESCVDCCMMYFLVEILGKLLYGGFFLVEIQISFPSVIPSGARAKRRFKLSHFILARHQLKGV